VAILLNAAGRPEPSPEVTRRLLAVSPALFLRHMDHLGPQWAVCCAWFENDARWAGVRDGSVDPARAFDIIGYLPMDCALEEAPAYLERMLRAYPREDVNRMADAIIEFNETKALQPEVDAAIADVLDRADPTGLTPTRRARRVVAKS
jgi:hypothetical protein